MRRFSASALALVLGLGCFGSAPARALAADDGDDVKFETFDKVEIKGKFFPGDKKSPCVILLHKYGGSCKEDELLDLAKALKEKKFAVLMFDFRGHGESTSIKNPAVFWALADNRTGLPPIDLAHPRSSLGVKEFRSNYPPLLVNDIAAARMFLDRKNDDGVCNSRSIILVGAEDGAVLGAMWAYSEMYRYKVLQGFKPDTQPEGTDIMGAVWISMNGKLDRNSERAISWLTDLGRTHKVPMTFIYGEKDTASSNFATRALDEIRPDKDNKKFDVKHPIKDTKAVGTKLLTKDVNQDIVNYLDRLREDKSVATWDTKDPKKAVSVWLLRGGLVQRPAKMMDDEAFNLIPTFYFRQ